MYNVYNRKPVNVVTVSRPEGNNTWYVDIWLWGCYIPPPPPVYQSLDTPLLYKSYPESLLPDWKAIQWLNRTSIIAPCYNTRRRGVSGSAVYWFNGIRIRHHCIANLRFPLKQKLKKKEETIKTKVNIMIEAPKTVNLIYKVIHIHDQGMCLVKMCTS